MWSNEETRVLLAKWQEESARTWASAGSKTFKMIRISELMQEAGMDRDVSQVEGKIKSLRRDWKAFKSGQAIPQTYKRITPFMKELEKIFQIDRY